ncbi:hypothetical protein GQE99_14995 [Maritimibacter sp. DP07]|uniref:Uncharacterized protein n=1 Tax=Maritimibacter harenae TaxID=2606218 RepID=A0A845MAK9_9RHOB|nr:hypothetical protein [Maritimibacter harenae]MZR14324.1 hypothetical protein [Maritimibacter harenae]
MNQFSPVRTQTENPLSAFLDQHGAGLARLLEHIYGPLGAAAFRELSRFGSAPPQARDASLVTALEEATGLLLDFVGMPLRAPDNIRPQEFDQALRWYAARLRDLRLRG